MCDLGEFVDICCIFTVEGKPQVADRQIGKHRLNIGASGTVGRVSFYLTSRDTRLKWHSTSLCLVFLMIG
jgi:hypothetical protein